MSNNRIDCFIFGFWLAECNEKKEVKSSGSYQVLFFSFNMDDLEHWTLSPFDNLGIEASSNVLGLLKLCDFVRITNIGIELTN